MLEEHFDRVARRHITPWRRMPCASQHRVHRPVRARSTSLIYRILAANPISLRWALAPKTGDGRGAARCRASWAATGYGKTKRERAVRLAGAAGQALC